MRRLVLLAALVGALLFPLSERPAAAAGAVVGVAATATGAGHWTTDGGGTVTADGDADHLGDLTGMRLTRPVVGMAATPTGRGYWLVASDGGIFTFGDAAFHGSTGAIRLNQPIVGMTATPTGRGYWLVASDGGIFTFGDAAFHGSTGAIRLNQPIVGMTPTTTGRGYWLVASDGGIFRFGDAGFHGSAGAMRLPRPVVGMAVSPTGRGYWVGVADGSVHAFGDAVHLGSAGRPVTAMTGGAGYRLASADGTVTAFARGTEPVTAATARRDAGLWPFASDSPWNTSLGSGARYVDQPALRLGTAWVNASQWSHPVYQARSTDPVASLSQAGKPAISLQVPVGAVPAVGSDSHLHVVDPTGRWVDETFGAGGALPNLTAKYHVRTDLHGPGVGQEGVRAYGGSALGGLIRTWELQQASIRHVLAVGIDGNQLKRGPVWPATREDGNAAGSYSGPIPMGTLVAIPPSVDVGSLGLSREGLAVARALQDFGGYVVDRAGCTCLYAEPSAAGPMVDAVRKDFTRLRGLLQVVANNGPTSVGGGGVRRAPAAPPLG